VIIVVDTNIIFSGLLNPDGKISDLLLNSSEIFEFYAPSFLLDELESNNDKLLKISKLSEDELGFLKRILLKKIELIDIENIHPENWIKSIEISKEINEYDAPFIALSLELNSPLWTGDKKLTAGLKKKNFDFILDTEMISKIRNTK
jgi:predicted nucleic acid-binding protein